MILSIHIADVGRLAALKILRVKLSREELPGLRYAQPTLAAPLTPRVLPSPKPGRVGLIAAWSDEQALERFLAEHPLARKLAGGWRVRLAPTRVVGAWSELPGLRGEGEKMADEEPAAVLTLGRLRLTQTVRFLRASAAAEELALGDPALLASTALARPPRLVATFSLWRATAPMRAYAAGDAHAGHVDAVRAHAARPYHSESAFVRFRPYGACGSWDGIEPLARARDRESLVSG